MQLPLKKFIAVMLLLSGTLAWFFLLNYHLNDIFSGLMQNDPLWTFYNLGSVIFYGTAILSAITVSFFTHILNRTKFLAIWIALGVFATVSLILFQGTPLIALSSLLLGISLGLGLPSSMAFLADCTVIEERARISGLIILATFIIAFATIAGIGFLQLDFTTYILLFAAVRGISFLALFFDKCDGKELKEAPSRVFKGAFREFLFYLTPWIMFCIAAGLASNLVPQSDNYASAVTLGTALRYVFIALFGLIAGIIADRIGRKPPIIIALIMLGISFGLLGFAMSPLTVLIYLASTGIAWGLLFVVFLAVPGDLSQKGSREKFYGIGYISPLAILFALTAIPGIAIFSDFPASSFSQILSIILFVAIIPVLRAKETLPQKKIEERKMKTHLKKIEEIIRDSSEG